MKKDARRYLEMYPDFNEPQILATTREFVSGAIGVRGEPGLHGKYIAACVAVTWAKTCNVDGPSGFRAAMASDTSTPPFFPIRHVVGTKAIWGTKAIAVLYMMGNPMVNMGGEDWYTCGLGGTGIDHAGVTGDASDGCWVCGGAHKKKDCPVRAAAGDKHGRGRTQGYSGERTFAGVKNFPLLGPAPASTK